MDGRRPKGPHERVSVKVHLVKPHSFPLHLALLLVDFNIALQLPFDRLWYMTLVCRIDCCQGDLCLLAREARLDHPLDERGSLVHTRCAARIGRSWSINRAARGACGACGAGRGLPLLWCSPNSVSGRERRRRRRRLADLDEFRRGAARSLGLPQMEERPSSNEEHNGTADKAEEAGNRPLEPRGALDQALDSELEVDRLAHLRVAWGERDRRRVGRRGRARKRRREEGGRQR
mmetsp:Transcript_23504/g.64814  ORF Transcript_23504/g.64814 Transcript_23504/m.64814 type:complete len:233 (+) Transcript_23504:1038-1736(+)